MGALLCSPAEQIDFEADVNLSHFEVWRIIGKGAFGKVHIVQHKKTKQEYAIKYIIKEKCIKQNMTVHVIRERKLLEELHSPFICNLRYAFQDETYLLMVMDLKLGGDLRFHLKKEKTGVFPENRSKFYIAEITLGLEYLHSMKIIHRDIKPENVLLDLDGHTAITDFNVACKFDPCTGKALMKDLKPTANKVLTSMVGTPFYMAPEMVAKKLYDESVDFWSLGIMLYEFCHGATPFDDGRNLNLYNNIVNENVLYPKQIKVSKECKHFLDCLLEKNPSKRLGNKETGSEERLKKHKWFKDIDWSKIANRTSPVPFVPKENNANCDPDLILDDVLLNDNQLGAEKHDKNEKHKSGPLPDKDGKLSHKDTQLQFMIDNYKVFDFTKIGLRKSGIAGSHSGVSVPLSAEEANMGLGDDDVKPMTSGIAIAITEAEEYQKEGEEELAKEKAEAENLK